MQGGTGTDNLQLTSSGTEAIGKFLDFETLAMQGTRWTLNGTGSFATSAEVEVDPSNGDKTIVTGTVNLTGSVLKVLAAAGNYSASKQYIHHRQ